MLKNTSVIIILFTIMTILVGCDDDDFAPYTNYEKKLDVSISSYSSCVSDITNEVTKIAQGYQDKVELTHATIILKGSEQINTGKGIILFDFYKEHEKRNQITRVLLNYNMSTNKLDKIRFEQGHGKRVGGYSKPINKELIKASIPQLISDLYRDSEFQEKIRLPNPRLEIDYTNEINIRLYNNSKNEGPIYRKQLASSSSTTIQNAIP